MIFLTTNTAINVFLEEEFQNFGPEDTLFGEEFGLTTDRLPDFDELMALDTSQACKGSRYDVVRNLFNFGIKTRLRISRIIPKKTSYPSRVSAR